MTKYVTQVMHLDNGNSFEYVNYNGTWFKLCCFYARR